MKPFLHAALSRQFGELTMAATCSVARADELEQENAELRKLVTEERIKAQGLEAALASVTQAHNELVDRLAEQATPQPRRTSRAKPKRAPT